MLSIFGLQGTSSRFSGISNPQNPQHVAFLRSLKSNRDLEQPLSTRLDELQVIVFDLETTGFMARHDDEIISIGAVKFTGVGNEGDEHFYTLVNPERDIPDRITELTGINRESVADAPSLLEALRRFMGFVENRILVAHFSGHDKKFLETALWKTSRTTFRHRVIDTMMLFQSIYPDRQDFSLEALLFDLDLEVKQRHHALYDAQMAADLWKTGLRLVMSLGIETVEDLYHFLSKRD
jgi:DNA polymerase-3 subunit epsilon